MPSDAYLSGLWNGIESILSFWAQELEATLEANAPPTQEFWERMGQDLEGAMLLTYKAQNATASATESDAKAPE